jgi:hypothetical protein
MDKMTKILGTAVMGLALCFFMPVAADAATVDATPTTEQVATNTKDATNTGADTDTEEPLTPEEQAELNQAIKDQKLNDQANNANIRLQPWYTGSAIALNLSQIAYYLTGSVSNVVGQGTAIVQTGTGLLSTIFSLLKP